MNWIKIYTDASWDPFNHMAACGFIIVVGRTVVSKQVVFMEHVRTSHIAERFAILFALEELIPIFNKGDRVCLYTDQKNFVNDVKLDQGESLFKTKVKNVMDVMAINGVSMKIKHVKSHQRAEWRSTHNVYHDEIDRACLTELRKFQQENLLEPEINLSL